MGKELNDRLIEICGGIAYEDVETVVENTEDVTMTTGGLIRTPGVGQTCGLTVETFASCDCAIVNLQAGQKLEIKGVGGNAARLWAIVDKTTHVIEEMETNTGAPTPADALSKTIIAEEDCIVVVNAYNAGAEPSYGNDAHTPYSVKLTTYTTETVPAGTPVAGILNGMQEDIEELQDAAEGPLKGKKMVALGDSITYGFIPRNYTGYPGQLDSFAKLAAQRLGMTFANYGISGSSVTNISGRDPMCLRYDDLPSDADVITFMGGTNDVRNGAVLGTMSDRGTDTFYGALHTIMQGLYTKYIGGVAVATGKKKKVIICTPIKLLDASKSSQTNTIAHNAGVLVEWDAWIDAIKEVAAFYSFPVLDFYNLSGINPHLNRTLRGTQDGYTGYYNPYITDGTHPTQEGAEMMADLLVGFLKGLK